MNTLTNYILEKFKIAKDIEADHFSEDEKKIKIIKKVLNDVFNDNSTVDILINFKKNNRKSIFSAIEKEDMWDFISAWCDFMFDGKYDYDENEIKRVVEYNDTLFSKFISRTWGKYIDTL